MPPQGAAAEDAAPSRKSVLVVDDTPEIGEYFRRLFQRVRGVTVDLTVATDPRRAMEALAATPFDLVVSDYRMPGADGADVLATARRRHPAGRRVMMTAYNEIPTTVARLVEADVDAYLQKPLHDQDLLLFVLDFLHDNARAVDAARAQARELESLALREEAVYGAPGAPGRG